MVAPKHRKVRLKRALDATVFRGVLPRRDAARRGVRASRRASIRAAGIADERIVVRPHGFPDVPCARRRGTASARARRPRRRRRRSSSTSAGSRTARGSSCSCAVATQLPDVHVAIVGPDGGHGVDRELLALRDRLGVAGRVHFVGPLPREELPDRLRRRGRLRAAVARTRTSAWSRPRRPRRARAIVVTDRCGVAECFAGRGALVVPYDEARAPRRARAAARRSPSCGGGSARRRARSRRSGRGRAWSSSRRTSTAGRSAMT